MRTQITKDKEFYIISRSIDNAEKCTIIDVTEDDFKVQLHNKQKYEVEEVVELFTLTDKGQLYFETIIKSIDDDVISLWFPITFKHLQRREYSRIPLNKNITLSMQNKEISSQIIDLSAGGLKIKTQEQLNLLQEYSIELNIENKKITTQFEPIRIEATQQGYISSGRFKDINNYDRIALVQYCFKTQIENSNK
jgi:c-di-GMP-binding flagellar brake protein YcgR